VRVRLESAVSGSVRQTQSHMIAQSDSVIDITGLTETPRGRSMIQHFSVAITTQRCRQLSVISGSSHKYYARNLTDAMSSLPTLEDVSRVCLAALIRLMCSPDA